MDHISTDLDYVIVVLVDLCKAFNVINLKVLLAKNKKMGVINKALKYLKAYLEDRQYYTQVNFISSSNQNTTYGVSQGSVLGLLPFLIHVQSLHLLGLVGRYFLFADDILLVYKGKIHNCS